MATIADIGVPGQPLKTPPLTAWQAAVRDMLNRHETADVWTAWTPTITGGTVSATDCRYRRTPAGLITFDAHLTIATITGTFNFTIPVSAAKPAYGAAALQDANGGTHLAATFISSGVCRVYGIGTAGVHTPLTATSPFTWAAGDLIHVLGSYTAAPLP